MKKKVKMMAIACIAALSCQAQNTIFPHGTCMTRAQ